MDETIVEAELLEGRKALEIVERETKKEQQQFKAEVVEGFSISTGATRRRRSDFGST